MDPFRYFRGLPLAIVLGLLLYGAVTLIPKIRFEKLFSPRPFPSDTVIAAANPGGPQYARFAELNVVQDTIWSSIYSRDSLHIPFLQRDTFRTPVSVDFYSTRPASLPSDKLYLGTVELRNTGQHSAGFYLISRRWTMIRHLISPMSYSDSCWAIAHRQKETIAGAYPVAKTGYIARVP